MNKGIKAGIVLGFICILVAGAVFLLLPDGKPEVMPDQVLLNYGSFLNAGEYDKMYELLDQESKANISKSDFMTRNQKIYEGIQAKNISIEVDEMEDWEDEGYAVTYQMKMDSAAGQIAFQNQVDFTEDPEEKIYLLSWNDTVIFPELSESDKVLVTTTKAKRGAILDRNGELLAGEGIASSVGLVPGKMSENSQADIEKMAELLETSPESIHSKLDAAWVAEDSFVPVKSIYKASEIEILTGSPSEIALKSQALQEQLLEISGVMISDAEVRTYPFGDKAAHLTGYVQNVTAEDLEEHKGEGYDGSSVIGRSGMEALYEKELKGEDGCEIKVVGENGEAKDLIAGKAKKDGENIKLTIDAGLQSLLYDQYKEDKSTSAAMNPFTGEVLALVSTPSFDSNDFIMGMSEEKWAQLNENEDRPLYNRFRQAFAPGSVFKPITAGIGLNTAAIDAEKDYGSSGLSWQKDSGWGDYFITTLQTYSTANLENALIYSDNIYFAKAALEIGAGKWMEELNGLGFNDQLPFEITMSLSQFSNEGDIASEILLADSGYGQGQMLVNPLHLASLYTAFANEGNVIKPYLRYQESPSAEVWISEAFSAETAARIEKALVKVVESPQGTGHGAYRGDIFLAGKTGTAEIKENQEDAGGTELGWFGVFTPQKDMNKPILMMTMVEDVKDRGGSSYVVSGTTEVLNQYFGQAIDIKESE